MGTANAFFAVPMIKDRIALMPSMQWDLDQQVRQVKRGVTLNEIELDLERYSFMSRDELFTLSPLWHQWSQYVYEFADWKSFLTLTFERELSRETVYKYWRTLVQFLNKDLFGNHYTRIVGHSYFSYALCFEKQERGAYHLHALVDDRLNFNLCHYFWRKVAGFLWIVPAKDKQAVSIYVSKYVVKEGDLEMYKLSKYKRPSKVPSWYMLSNKH